MSNKSLNLLLFQSLLCIVVPASWLFFINEFSVELFFRYTSLCCFLFALNNSRSIKQVDAHLIIVGFIIIACGLTALFFHWPLAHETSLLGVIFVLIGYITFMQQLVEKGIYELLVISLIAFTSIYFISKITAWSSSSIIEIVVQINLTLVFLLKGLKKQVPPQTPNYSENSRKNILV